METTKNELQTTEETENCQEFVFIDRRDYGPNPMAIVDETIDSIMWEVEYHG